MVNDQAVDINTELDIVTWTTFMILFASFFKVESFTHSLQNCKENVYVCAPQNKLNGSGKKMMVSKRCQEF